MTWLTDWIGKLPTMQARVLVTLIAFACTTLVHLAVVIYVTWKHVTDCTVLAKQGIQCVPAVFWVPDYTWLGFLIVMSGLDLKGFQVKRTTDASYVAAQTGTPPVKETIPPPPEVAPT